MIGCTIVTAFAVVLVAGHGACTSNDSDKLIWNEGGDASGQITFFQDMLECGMNVWLGGEQIVADCIQNKNRRNYSDACAWCFGALAQCGYDDCQSQCWPDAESNECEECSEEKCAGEFEICSGFALLPRERRIKHAPYGAPTEHSVAPESEFESCWDVTSPDVKCIDLSNMPCFKRDYDLNGESCTPWKCVVVSNLNTRCEDNDGNHCLKIEWIGKKTCPVPIAVDGACASNDSDKLIWNEGGEASGQNTFSQDMVDCVMDFWWGGAPMVASCIQDKDGRHYSEACALCFGEFARCGHENCQWQCWPESEPEECAKCTEDSCFGEFNHCSGFAFMPNKEAPDQAAHGPPAQVGDAEQKPGLSQVETAGDGVCALNDSDKLIWNGGGDNSGRATFPQDMLDCGIELWLGGASRVAGCIQDMDRRNYSDACALCFGEFAQCGFDICKYQCWSDEAGSEHCGIPLKCSTNYCSKKFIKCSGFALPTTKRRLRTSTMGAEYWFLRGLA